MSLTVRALHTILSDLIVSGHGRKPVCIDKTSFTHPLEQDGAVILHVASVEGPRFVANADDDGGQKWNKDGSESGKQIVILKGDQ